MQIEPLQPLTMRSHWYQWQPSFILEEQVKLTQRNLSATLLASALTAIVTVWALFTLVTPTALWWWLASHLLMIAIVYACMHWVLPRASTPECSAWLLLLCMTVVGLHWGSLAWVCVSYGQADAVLYASAIIGGVSSGALGMAAPLYLAFLSYLVSTVGMVVLAFAYLGGPIFMPWLGLALIYFSLTCLQARTADKASTHSIMLRIENNALVQRLRQESEQSQGALAFAETAQSQAEAMQERAEKANIDKSKFLAAASHDLRQPLHAMGLFLETLARSKLTPQQISVLQHAHAASTAASEMLTTLLDFSRLDAGVVKSQPRPFLLQPLLVNLEQEYGQQADAKGLVYRSHETALATMADPHLTDLVLRNLITNAIRYTDRGGVLVACRARAGGVAIEVWDTGIGIPLDQHTEVFKEFNQLGNSERDRRKGLGLGLAIVQRLSAAMNATITLHSEPGRGSVFRLCLPRFHGIIVPDRNHHTDQKSLVGMRVLVIDDEEPVRLGMYELLTSWGCICHTADDLSSALQYVALQPMDAQPEVILADYRLREGATGGQAISALRAYLTLRGHEQPLPAIIITGDTAPARLREAQRSDATLLHKPVSASALEQALIQLR